MECKHAFGQPKAEGKCAFCGEQFRRAGGASYCSSRCSTRHRIANLRHDYVRGKLRKVIPRGVEIPEAVIEAKRLEMASKRKLKKLGIHIT
jgi:hypothetical protein